MCWTKRLKKQEQHGRTPNSDGPFLTYSLRKSDISIIRLQTSLVHKGALVYVSYVILRYTIIHTVAYRRQTHTQFHT